MRPRFDIPPNTLVPAWTGMTLVTAMIAVTFEDPPLRLLLRNLLVMAGGQLLLVFLLWNIVHWVKGRRDEDS